MKIQFDGLQRAKMRYSAVELFDTVLDVVYPPRCVHCHRSGSVLCSACQKRIRAAPLFADRQPTEALDRLDGVLASGLFEGALQSAVHELKYNRKLRLAVPLAARLVHTFRQSDWLPRPTLITAVPLHSKRLAERGYNQAGLLAGRFAAAIDLPFAPHALQRTRETRSQVGLGYAARQTNLTDAFAASPFANDQAVVIIDDVYTTGATLRACAAALRIAGARQVWALTVAAAALRNDSTDIRDI